MYHVVINEILSILPVAFSQKGYCRSQKGEETAIKMAKGKQHDHPLYGRTLFSPWSIDS